MLEMDPETVFWRLAEQIRAARTQRGLTQAQLARKARVSRLTLIKLERGAPSVAAGAYVDVACAMGFEFAMVPKRMPTMEEAREIFAGDG